MSKIKRTDRMDFFIEEKENIILIQQKWQYIWHTKTTPWNIAEKRKFHKEAELIINKIWSSYFKLKVEGSSDFVKRNIKTIFTVNFDIKWVLANPHWTVNITKILPDDFLRSNIIWDIRQINIDTEDLKFSLKKIINSQTYHQFPIAHEFGHTVGNAPIIGHSDEYNADPKINGGFQSDYSSLMNVGNQLRNRHLDYILKELNTMLPDTTFKII